MVSLERLRQDLAAGAPPGHADDDGARRQWWAALATLQDDFLLSQTTPRGCWLAAPLPALYEPRLLEHLRGWVWTPGELDGLLRPPPRLPGARPAPQAPETKLDGSSEPVLAGPGVSRLPLRAGDGTDPLLVVITPELQVALALHGPPQARQLLVRFDPASLSAALGLLHSRLEEDAPAAAEELRELLEDLGPLRSDGDPAQQFWPRLAERLAAMAPSVTLQPLVHGGRRDGDAAGDQRGGASTELALLEALTHEVRTPLATIRTLIRSLLRRTDLSSVVRQRLEQIDGECSEQIDRFGLIFHAAELQRNQGAGARPPDGLARTDLSQLLHQLEPLWQRQLQRRGHDLELCIDADLPPVLSDPNRLETMLGGLVDRFSRGLASGARLQVSLQAAGSRLKLQLRGAGSGDGEPSGDHRAVGPVLSWNPTTGSLQLSHQATQRLFHSLGGRLTERSGSALTVFFPLA